MIKQIKCPYCNNSEPLWGYIVANEEAMDKEYNRSQEWYKLTCDDCVKDFEVKTIIVYEIRELDESM